jgi:nucleotidyltransferase substrate binding protein (TIGR01987 family)
MGSEATDAGRRPAAPPTEPQLTGGLERAITALEQVNALVTERWAGASEPERAMMRSATIQDFEVAYEVAWKQIARWLNRNTTPGVADGVSRRQLYLLALESRLIADVDQWMGFHKARNSSSHIYEESTANEVFAAAKRFAPAARALLARLSDPAAHD